MKRLTLIGTKEFSEQIINFANRTGEFEFVGYFDDLVEKGTIINGKPVLGKVEDAIELYKQGVFDYIFEGIGYTRFDLREYYYYFLKGKVPFANIIMPDAYVDSTVKMGEGVFVGPRSYVDSNVVIEDNVFLRLDVVIGHDTLIQSHSYYSGVNRIAGFCSIGKKVFLGTAVMTADDIKIVDETWVGIGCVVAKNIDKPAKYVSPSVRIVAVPEL